MNAVDLRLYAVADPALTAGRHMVEAVLEAIAGGATLVQLRDKGDDARATVALGRALRAAMPATVPLVINDRVDIAHAAGAEGVHLGRRDLTPAMARAVLGERAIVGITLHHAHEAEADAAIDYAWLGPVYATSSKDPGDPPLGADGLRILAAAACERLGPVPLCAIAGIDARRVGEVIAAGVDGIAVIGALFKATDIAGAARELRLVVDASLAARSVA
jgi:thiamine-phosphate pyrophosphorylase